MKNSYFKDTKNNPLTDPAFNRFFILGTGSAALILGLLAMTSPTMFMAVLLIDIWLFANPHIIATFSRIAFDRVHAKKHWFLLYTLPFVVLIGVTIAALAYGVEGLFTFYFIAQTYHVTRQSFGISRAYLKLNNRNQKDDFVAEGLIYVVPLWGLAHRCAQSPTEFLGYTITLPSPPSIAVELIGFLSIIWLGVWLIKLLRSAHEKSLNLNHCIFVSSHILITLVSFFICTNITEGWLIFNLWHNIQYLLFVWAQNLRRFSEPTHAASEFGEHPQKASLDKRESTFSLAGIIRKGKFISYYFLILIVGTMLYQGLTFAGEQLAWLGLPTVLVLHFTFNYHHYLVDGIIWKKPGFIQKLFSFNSK